MRAEEKERAHQALKQGLGQGAARVIADREAAFLAREDEAVAPHLVAVGLDLQVEAVGIRQLAGPVTPFGVAALGVVEHLRLQYSAPYPDGATVHVRAR